MFGIPSLSNCGLEIWHQIIIVLSIISHKVNMFLGRSESLKWIRQKFSKRNNTNPSSGQIEHTPAKITKTHNETCENIRDLNEILVITTTTTPTITSPVLTTLNAHNSAQFCLPTSIHSDEVMPKINKMPLLPPPPPPPPSANDMSHPCTTTAPIAREEDEEENDDDDEDCTAAAAAVETECNIEKQINKENMLKANSPTRQRQCCGDLQQPQPQQQQQHEHDVIDSNDVINENVVRRSSKSSRVRNYLRKCKDRWLLTVTNNNNNNNGGQDAEQNQQLQHLEHDPVFGADTKTLCFDLKSNVSQHPLRVIEKVTSSSASAGAIASASDSQHNNNTTTETTISDELDITEGIATNGTITNAQRSSHHHDGHGNTNFALGSAAVGEIEDDDIDDADGYHEDIDFGLRCNFNKVETTTTISSSSQGIKLQMGTNANNFANKQRVTQRIKDNKLANDHVGDQEINAKHLIDSNQVESQLAFMIDSQLACIYPVFNQTTRAVLIREARDVLVKAYHGCLQTFQRQFLSKFAEIAVTLRERHRIGEALIWCQGWPLVTPIGQVILHLGNLDDNQLQPAEIYLCVKTVDANDHEPQLYVTWRTPTAQKQPNPVEEKQHFVNAPDTGASLRSCQLDYHDNTLYLSTVTLEMLNDDLPQLLQSLLLGVEHNLERLSFSQLNSQTANTNNYDSNRNQLKIDSNTTPNNGNNNNNNATPTSRQLMKTQIPNSPKCGLRRSDLITKNKLNNNKYMLRRFTNRQDSMNSTSSGNSSASGLSSASNNSSSSDSPLYGKIASATNGSNKVPLKNENETKSNDSNSSSPALPRFCLGTSFPHIDSDEENAEERRHSLTDDQLESEIVPPNLITDLSEKLLLSGIYLPGTRDVKGNPLVTVEAESVLTAGLNCYEIATLLLYYSTIPERSVQANNNNLSTGHVELSTSPQRSSNQLETTTATTTTATTSGAIQQASTTTAAAAATIAVTTSTTTTSCTSVNDNVQQQPPPSDLLQLATQHRVTFTILIAITKSQHLCVIDLISQSLKLLTRHIAYSHLLVVCVDVTLLPNTSTGSTTTSISTNPNEDIKPTATATTTTDMINEKPSTLDSNGNWRCHKKTETHTITYLRLDEVTTSGGLTATATPSGCLGGLHHHDARKWHEFFVLYEPFYQQCAGAAQRLVAALNDIRHADLQGLPTRRQLYAQHRALSRALMDSELHNLRKRSAATMARLHELAKSINATNNNNNTGSNCNANHVATKANSYCGIKSKTSTIANCSGAGVGATANSYYSATINRSKIMGSHSVGSGYSFNYQGNQNNKTSNNNNNNNNDNNNNINNQFSQNKSSSIYSTSLPSSSTVFSAIPNAITSRHNNSNNNNNNNSFVNNNNNSNSTSTTSIGNIDVAIRLQKVSLLYTEIDRAAKRLEQLTEQRREHLRELTRQRALEDEINEVTSWITNDGSDSLQRFINFELDWDTPIREREHEFEKYYFISMKNLAKGRDLHLAASNMESLKESAIHLKNALDCFAEKLESARERIEGATRLHHLLHTNARDEEGQQEIERLAAYCGAKALLEKCHNDGGLKRKPESLNLSFSHNNSNSITNMQKSVNITSQIVSSTPDVQHKNRSLICQRKSSYGGTGSYECPTSATCHCWRDSRNLDDEIDEGDMIDNDGEEAQSKIADSGVGECQRCEGNPKLTRMCSCQSLNEETENFYKKNDELEDECFERPSKCYISIHSPVEANKHLQCFASTFELPKLEELSCLEPKIQKTLLLIMREMIGTERDYVRSLYYVIDNYIDELLRDDIPQSMRGQRNVIFGNIEKIFEFHNNHFLAELERYENNPLRVGAAFLQMESQFYLYALYNKNKPKSDTLMSEYGTAFFKTKQFELNDKMDLASYLLKPVQRMGKYALLLQQLVKACSTVQGTALQEIATDVEELQKAEEMVKFQLRHGNDLLAMDSLRDCDVNVKEQGRLLRQNEFLVWQGRGGKKTLRHIFLFEELVLFSKARRFPDHKNLDIYIYKNSIKTSDIGLTAHVGDSPTKFEIWFRKRKPEDTWTLQCMSEDIKNTWTEEISKLLWQQAKKNRDIRLAEMSSMGIGSKPCLDIRPSNNQINDRSITFSQLGKAPKLRHSFVGLHSDQIKASRRPHSLISESSLSSGTSSSSLSKSSTSSTSSSAHHHQPHSQSQLSPISGLELITESQTLSIDYNENGVKCHNHPILSHTLSSGYSSHGGGGGTGRSHRNNHKRSTTIVSQMSTESGIISDICITPDQDNNEFMSTWPGNSTDANQISLSCLHSHNNKQIQLLKCHTLSKKSESSIPGEQNQQQQKQHHSQI